MQKPGISNQVNQKNGREGKTRNGSSIDGKTLPKTQAIENPSASSNHFVVLSSSANIPILEEGEFQQLEEQDGKVEINTGPIN